MMTTLCAIVGLVLLVLTSLSHIIAFATPYWLVEGSLNRGLWAYCTGHMCTWVFQAHVDLPEQNSVWWQATQGLMSLGLGLALMALLVATVALCCECKGCNSSHAVCGLLLLTFLSTGVAMVIFGACGDVHLGAGLSSVRFFGWWRSPVTP